jgi:uncharacterized heparinase superfamily protein
VIFEITMKPLKNLLLLLFTVRHLRIRQVAFQFWYRLRPAQRLAPSQNSRLADRVVTWDTFGCGKQSYFAPNTFEFLNVRAEVHDWNEPKFEKLWLYNLHYFDDLNAYGSSLRTAEHSELLRRWIAENPPMTGNGWEPYPLSLRIVNWIKWLQRFPSLATQELLDSLHTQVRALERQIEYHILANHLFANVKALVFAGYFFDGTDAKRWCTLGCKLLQQELSEQFLVDGAHYERSPMYHCILLWDVLDLINLLSQADNEQKEIIQELRLIASRGISWLREIIHPDQRIPFFNDSTFGVAPEPEQIFSYASKLGITGTDIELAESGFVRLALGEQFLVGDAGAIAPNYQPGHAHAQVGSFEYSIGSKRVLVNSGTSVYGISTERSFQRSTSAHNSVTVVRGTHEINSSEIWSGFRVARRAKVTNDRGPNCFKCSVDGFWHGFRKSRHFRLVELEESVLRITDSVFGSDLAHAYFYVHPQWQVISEGASVKLISGSSKVVIDFEGAVKFKTEPSHWYSGFGGSEPNNRIVVTFKDKLETIIKS